MAVKTERDVCNTDVSGNGARSLRARGHGVKSALTVIEKAASECGLAADDIITLVTVVTANKLRKFYDTDFRL